LKSNQNKTIIALRIRVEGLVQGVGFRPFVYRLAKQYGLQGWVVNGTDGVTIKVEGPAAGMPFFIDDIRFRAPVVSQIEKISIDHDITEGLHGFFILSSRDLTDETSEISPDIAVCPECLADLRHQPHRLDYPFINCTNCGPRFSIVRDFPYDRAKTTMAPFEMCPKCSDEYSDIMDRRFHAQPVACNHCGPHYSMHKGSLVITDFQQILDHTGKMIETGQIIALKGSGGFHLMCNALDDKAINRLRNLKQREGKPFAVMFRDIDNLKKYAAVSEAEETALLSWRRPIVILKNTRPLASGITLDLNTLGAFLPYMPIHHLLFEKISIPALVLTSGNIAEEPIIITNDAAIATFTEKVDAVITFNREIFNRNDDSVVRVISGRERIQRRSRGYVPAPVKLPFDVDGIMATGAELSNCFCLGKGNRAYLSQHIGDLKNQETYAFYEETQSRFQKLFRVKPTLVTADLHPDYLSTRFARKSGLETILVQHHHAHIASCMAENGIDEPVIGLAFDGTGYGTDGHIWGGEFMVCDYEDFKRHIHFAYMPMPGGDRTSEEPWRMGISLLWQAFGKDFSGLDLPLLRLIDRTKIRRVAEAIEKGINCPFGSGAGRLFDAIAAITGICVNARFHAEAPMRLESIVKPGIQESYNYTLTDTISFLPAIRQICADLSGGADTGIIAARFHNTITGASLQAVKNIRAETGIQKVVLSGGTFQNKYLHETLETKLLKNNFAVYTHCKLPCNDGGIALGQMVVAARRKKGQETRDKGQAGMGFGV
jgi:hydrogenase maturation protein HypF